MPKATPSKAALPKAPKKPKKTQDVALYAQRKRKYDADFEIYTAAMEIYNEGQKARKAAKRKAAPEEVAAEKKGA